MCFEGAIYAVSLLEVTAQEISFDDDRHIIWPRSVGKKELPVFDGVLVLYDATNPNSILESSRLIGKCDILPNMVKLSRFVMRCGLDTRDALFSSWC
jgi:hypothetical protein